MNKTALVSGSATVAIALLSAMVLYETAIANNYLGEVGLAGMFLASMLSHLTVVGRDLFVPMFLPLTCLYHPIILGSTAGWGGAIGEITTYYWGLGIGKTMEREDTKNILFKWIDKYGLVAILLVAASPLPDTPIILLAGSARFPVSKLLLIEGIGKTLWYSLATVLGGFLFTSLTDIVGNLVASSIIIVASTAFCLVVYWEKIGRKIFELVKKAVTWP